MKTDDQTFAEYLHILRRRARPAAMAALAVLLGMTAVVFSLPAVYESYATLLIQQPEISPEVLGGATAKEYVEQRLQQTRQLVMTAENTEALIERFGLFEDDEGTTLEEKISRFNESVVITPQVTGVVDPRSMRGAELTYAFSVAFHYGDPKIAKDVATALADQFTTMGSTRTKAEAEKTSSFMKAEADRLEAELRQREARIAEFLQAHGGGLPEDRAGNFNRARDLERDLARVDDDLRAARARKDLLDAQLAATPRDRPVLDATGQPVIRGEDRLAAAQQELVAALAKYSEDHPDVRRLRREIATLTSEVAGGVNSPPTNPIYQQMQTQVNAADLAVRDLTARRYDIASSLAQVKGAIYQSPVYAKQYADLVRDHELVKTQYEQMRTRQATAEITKKAAGAEAAETYVLINPAFLPTQPVEPDRIALMFLAFVLASAAGIGTTFILNAADTTIRGNADVALLLGAAPLGNIPVMRSAVELHQRRLNDLKLVGGMLAATAIVLFAVS